ncbi:ATP-grasp domain-containing protein [Hippea alviniae]|uniref:ATP-grasp domain-containing protein n=1 Tax=Hippea alviniae TaxID=1279027 RepID=UPI0003B7328A|nr:ATP-grasp domain-containing protein [Hippea alviniae]
MDKAVYLIGVGKLGLRILEWAKELGLKIILTDKNKSAPGLGLADEVLIADGSDVDAHLQFSERIKRKYRIVGGYCSGEFCIETLNRVLSFFGVKANDNESVYNVLNKERMKKIWEINNIPTPKWVCSDDKSEIIDFIKSNSEVIIKPSKGSGSRGVRFVRTETMEDFYHEYNTDLGKIIVESFIRGRQIDVNGVYIDEIFYPCGVLEKFITPLPNFLPIGGYDPANISEREVVKVYDLLDKACRAIGIKHGPVKGDFIRTDDGKYFVLEVSARFHGNVTTVNTLPFGSGINPIKFYFNYLAKEEIDISFLKSEDRKYATWRVLAFPPGKVIDIQWPSEISDKITMLWFNEKCKRSIDKYVDTTKIPGYICAYGNDKNDVENLLIDFFYESRINILPDKSYINWYKSIGKKIEEIGFSKKGCGFIEI